jgi:S1-C subfamily serine protease
MTRQAFIGLFRSRRRAMILTAALAAAGLSAGVWLVDTQAAAPRVAAAETGQAAAPAPGVAVESFAPVVERVAPAVVAVYSDRVARARPSVMIPDDPFFERFFGQPGDRFGDAPRAPEFRQRGVGSGVIVTPDGYVLTNHHVIDGADSIAVELNDRRRLEATLVGSDPPSDLAVLKIEDGADLPTIALGDSSAVRIGDVVLAIGNPLGIGQTVTMGIISAKGRATRAARRAAASPTSSRPTPPSIRAIPAARS